MPYDYDHCHVCGQPVSTDQARYARSRVQDGFCASATCQRQDVITRYGCCAKAEIMNCVCAYAFKCPDHGTRHIGSHE